MEDVLSEDPHLSDTELIEFASRPAGLPEHVSRCTRCSETLQALQIRVDSDWSDPAAVSRREARIRTAEILGEDADTASPDEDAVPWWRSALEWVSLAPLQPAGAFAADAAVETIKFPVYQGDMLVIGLSGLVQRRGPEFYIRVTASPESRPAYQRSLVEVVVATLETGRTMVQRRIGLEQFILLGTNLDVAAQRITARLLP
ncbi:MAG: hypothetical protein ACLQVD_14555 [Capsulimonadaceae bacterium]